MYKHTTGQYFSTGVRFLREHPQVWFTALVGFVIIAAFVFMAHRFATIAEDAQEDLINVRIGSIFDALVLFAPDVLHEQDILRTRLQQIKAQNETIEYLMVVAPHGNSEWRVYVRDDGAREGTVYSLGDPAQKFLYAQVLQNPDEAFTLSVVRDSTRFFMTGRAITNSTGAVQALVISEQGLSEADKQITDRLRTSMYLLIGVLLFILVLFIRHARIVDYATLYKKQLEIDEMKDSFISMASHELKSPLSVIRGYIEFLKDGVSDEEKRREYLRRIDLSATELRQLVDDILDVSRIEMGRLRFSPDYVKPVEVLEEVAEMFTIRAEGKGLTVSFTPHDDVCDATIRVDRGRLKQVIVNLVSNAVKYTLTGTITLEQKRVGNTVEISVRDTGVGMTAEEQKRLFGKFYRAEADETRGVSGTGLGLWITKYIIEHMGGSISAESIKGEGSRFVVIFPSVKPDVDKATV